MTIASSIELLLSQETSRDLQLAQHDLKQAREQLADRHNVTRKLEQRLDGADTSITQLRREAAENAGILAQVRPPIVSSS